MTIFSWNVNGLRAVIKKGAFDQFLQKYDPDILLLQEIKVHDHQIELDYPKYNIYLNSAEKAGYSGTAIFSKQKPLEVKYGLPEDLIKKFHVHGDIYGEPNKEGRVLTAEYSNFYLVSVYTPNAKDDLSRLDVRHKQWDPAFLAYMKHLNKIKPVIFGGDLNVAHSEDDLANPKSNVGKKGFTNEERTGIDNIIKANFKDSFRSFHEGNGFYTWWSYFAKSRERNVGWRIDYLMVADELSKYLTNGAIHPEITGSDHCPISVDLNL